MEIWLVLAILSLVTYYLVKHNVSSITRTPVWLLWSVIMAPAAIWTLWWLIYGENTPLPPLLILGPFVLCPLFYFWLIEKGRITPEPSTSEPKANPTEIKPIGNEEEKTLRNCFPGSLYFLQHIDYKPQAILCRGKLKAIPEVAYQTIKDNVEKAFGDRFLVLFQESLQGQPFFALVTNPWAKSPTPANREVIFRPSLALGLLATTFFFTTWMGVRLTGIEDEQLFTNLHLFSRGLPYSLGLLTILGVHELSHYGAALYYKIRTTLPYFMPVPFFLGTFGAFIQMKSPIPHRRALFDVGIAGPLGGMLVTIPILLLGLSWSEIVPLDTKDHSLLNFQSLNPRFSFLLAILAKVSLGNRLGVGDAIDLHPLAVAGYIGLIITALNLLPVGQLDGGHIVHAMYGQKIAVVVGQVTRFLVLILSLVKPDFLIWAIFLMLMPISDQPALNDVTELDNRRDILGLFSLVLLIMILLPLPRVIAQWMSL
jgi:hypothetical protein